MSYFAAFSREIGRSFEALFFLTPSTRQLLFGFCYPRFVGDARDVGWTCGGC